MLLLKDATVHTECDDWLRLRFAPNYDWKSAKDWVKLVYQQCERGDSGHEACHKVWKKMDAQRSRYYTDSTKTQTRPFLPWRLIDVSMIQPRLVRANEVYDKGSPDLIPKYTALSYCWGDSKTPEQLKLTSDNSAILRAGVSMDDLSAAQYDAIEVTRAMGFRYLWNDALCIIQDDSDDWAREAATMGAIYQYAALTIVSLMSNHQDGFLRTARHRAIDKIEIPFRSRIRYSTSGDYEEHVQGSYNLSFDGIETKLGGPTLLNKLSDTLPSNRWVTRGWTFQEQNHSLRMLICWQGGIRFNCPMHSTPFTYSESSGVDGVDPAYWWSNDDDGGIEAELTEDSFNKSHTVVRDIFGSTRWPRRFLYFTWLRFATDYSRRVFGRGTDIFSALWATAHFYEKRLEDDYLMGIWKNDPWGFLWHWGNESEDARYHDLSHLCNSYNGPDERDVEHIATWSWMGKQGIKFLHQTGTLCDDLDLRNFRSECNIDSRELRTRNGKHTEGYEQTTLNIRTKHTEPVIGYCDARVGNPKNEVTVPVRYTDAKVFCVLDFKDYEMRPDGSCYFGYGQKTCFLLLASAEVSSRTDGSRAALGLIITQDYTDKEWYRCGVFVAKPPEGWQGSTCGGLKIFDDSREETIRLK